MPHSASGNSFSSTSVTLAWSDAYASSAIRVGYGVFQRLMFALCQEKTVGRWIRTMSPLFFVLQFITLSLEQCAMASGSLKGAARWISLIRAPEASVSVNSGLVWAGFSVLMVCAVAMMGEYIRLYRGAVTQHKRVGILLRRFLSAVPALVMPLSYVCFRAFKLEGTGSDSNSTRGAVAAAAAAVTLLLLIITSVIASIFVWDFNPNEGHLSSADMRELLFTGILGIIVSLAHAFALPWKPWFYALVCLVGFLILFFCHWHMLPLWSKGSNSFLGGCVVVVVVLSVIQLASSFVDDSVVPFAIACGCIVPSLVVGYVVFLFRCRHFEKYWRDGFPATAYVMNNPKDATLVMRRMYNVEAEVAKRLFPRAIEFILAARNTFPREATIRLEHARVMYEVGGDPVGAAAELKEAKRFRAAIDTQYLISSLLQMCHAATMESERKEDVMARLDIATKHHKMSKAYSSKFWQVLVRSHTDSLDTEQLLGHVRTAGYHRNKCSKLLVDLLQENPRSVPVLRAWAKFLLELKNDAEAAEQALVFSDECEEEQSKRHKDMTKKTGASFVEGRAEKDQGVILVDIQSPEPEDSQRRIRFGGHTENPLSEAIESEGGTQHKLSDKLSESSMSLHSAASAGTLQADNTARGRHLRRKIETSKSTVIKRLHLVGLATLGVLIIGGVANYAVSVASMQSSMVTLDSMSKTISARTYISMATFKARQYESAYNENNITEAKKYCASSLVEITTFQELLTLMFEKSASLSSVSSAWEKTVSVKQYIPVNESDFSTGRFANVSLNMFDLGTKFINYARQVCNSSDSFDVGSRYLRATTSFRFVMDNPATFTSKLKSLGNVYAGESHDETEKIALLIQAIYPSTLAAALLVAILLFYPVVRLVNKERNSAIKLFLDIPKSSVINTAERLSQGLDDDHSNINSARRGLSSIQKLGTSYVAGFLFAVVICSIIFAVALSFSTKSRNEGYAIAYAGSRKNAVIGLLFYSNEMIIDDVTTRSLSENLALADSYLSSFYLADNILKFSKLSQSSIRKDAKLKALWYERECPESLGLSGCTGLETLLDLYISKITTLIELFRPLATNSSASYSKSVLWANFNTAYAILETLESWLDEDLVLMKDYTANFETLSRTVITAVFWTGLCVTFVLFAVIHLQIYTVNSEIEQVFKMLLFVPMNVLDSVQSIHDYLEMGRSATEIQSMSDKEQERVTKSIVDACEDIVILCNQARAIEMFNPIAEALTGYSAQEALGKDVGLVIPRDTKANASLFEEIFDREGEKMSKRKISTEIVVRKKDGTLFTSLVSVSRTVVHSKVTTALFIRDITAIKDHEKQISLERNRAKGLLLNIFPKQVAEQLDVMASGATIDGTSAMMAEQFAGATVLFADIAGFTNMSSKMTADDIVQMLNGVFTAWDDLLGPHGVEKIKTIGDAYMAVCGVPVRRADHATAMMRFAVAMLAALRRRNRTAVRGPPLSIRIGINAGPVAAGIIGKCKIAYDLWGDTVNVASRMEHGGVPGAVQVTEGTYQLLKGEYLWESRGLLPVQGKGELMCYVHRPTEDDLDRLDCAQNGAANTSSEKSEQCGGSVEASGKSKSSIASTLKDLVSSNDALTDKLK